MFGQDWLLLQEKPIFRKSIMDKIFNEVLANEGEDPLKITNAFLPLKDFDSTELISLVWNAATGMTQPYALSGNIPMTTIPGYFYKEYGIGYFREMIHWGEKELQLLKKPDKPNELAGTSLMVKSMDTLNKRMNNLIEFMGAQTIISGGYDVAGNGVNYRYLTGIPTNPFMLKLGATAHSSTVGVVFVDAPWIATPNDNLLWSDTTNSNPINDIIGICQLANESGFVITEMWLTPSVSALISKNANVIAWIQKSPILVGQYLTAPDILLTIPSLKGIKVVVDERRYQDERFLTADLGATGVTAYVNNGLNFCVFGQTLTFISPDGKTYAKAKVVASGTAPTATTITLATGGVGTAMVKGSRIVLSKPWLANMYGQERYVMFRTQRAEELGNWASTPSIVGGSIDNPRPGKFTWKDFSQEKGRPWIAVGAGIEGGPVVWHHGGYFVVQVKL